MEHYIPSQGTQRGKTYKQWAHRETNPRSQGEHNDHSTITCPPSIILQSERPTCHQMETGRTTNITGYRGWPTIFAWFTPLRDWRGNWGYEKLFYANIFMKLPSFLYYTPGRKTKTPSTQPTSQKAQGGQPPMTEKIRKSTNRHRANRMANLPSQIKQGGQPTMTGRT